MPFEKITANHRIAIFPSPMEADLAILPLLTHGSPSYPNEYVHTMYGFHPFVPDKSVLERGFALGDSEDSSPILYIVTENGNKSGPDLIEDNFLRALIAHQRLLRDKKVWLPILGPETQTMNLREGFAIIVRVLNQFAHLAPSSAQFIISIPDSPAGRSFFDTLQNETASEEANILILLNLLNAQIFLAGSYWDGDEQFENFEKEHLWKKGHDDDTYSDIIRSIKKGDILINKSAFPTKAGETILRLKAIGLVGMPSKDGASVIVDWKITGLRTDIPEYGTYNKTIERIPTEEAAYILSQLPNSEQQRFIDAFYPPPAEAAGLAGQSNSLKLAGLINDSEKGADYLDIAKDVAAFARVIAAKSFEPPLAIALFGQWGSGKSFFMRKLKERIMQLSGSNNNRTYCAGVAHIHFNAWSYMDANLWASFVSRIFEGLNEYISQNTKSDEFKKVIEKELGSSLQITKEEIQILEDKKQTIQRQLQSFQKERKFAKDNLKRNLNSLRFKSLASTLSAIDHQFHASEEILAACQENKTFIATEAELERIVPTEYLQNPSEAYRRINSALSFLREFFRWRSIWSNIIFLTFSIGFCFLIPLGLHFLTGKISQFNFMTFQPALMALIPLGVLLRLALTTYNRMKPVIAAFWKIKKNYEHKRTLATEQFKQREKALKLEIEKDSRLLLSLTTEIQKAEALKTDLQFKIDNILATEALYTFIEKRTDSEDYKKHLGIISIIRKDLEILNGLFTDHHEEIHRLKAENIRKHFLRPLERIVLYVDDLDRCPEETVVEVLEAVNLLMAFPLFIVIVGVDPRWVKNALFKRHSLQFAGYLHENSKRSPAIEMMDTSDYLEKIFQIPFHLKSAPPTTIREMIRKVAHSNQPLNEANPAASNAQIDPENEPIDKKAEPSDQQQLNPRLANLTTTIAEDIELLRLSEEEVKVLEDLGEIVGPNPRALKRFVNIYRIIKVHEDFSTDLVSMEEDILSVLFPLALSIGVYKKLIGMFENFFLEANNVDKTLSSFLHLHAQLPVNDKTRRLFHALEVCMSAENKSYFKLKQTNAAVFARHYNFTRRFTFSH
jgi:hypothetical protein